MAQRRRPSVAHEYDSRGQCFHCHMYEGNVLATSHVCTPAREDEVDAAEAKRRDMALEDYRNEHVKVATPKVKKNGK